MSNEQKPVAAVQQQDEDSDLEDLLDDVLDDFSTLSTKEKAAPAEPEKSKPASNNPVESEESLDDLIDQDEFAKQLAAGMEELMGGDQEMKDVFEKIWKSFEAPEANAGASQQTKAPAAGPSDKSFQDTIAQTMEKLKASSKEVDSSIAEEGQMDDAFMAEMMKQMEALAENGEFENVLEGMMQQLISKELLYEPMKDLSVRYPTWLEENKPKLSAADYDKYQKQYEICKQIVAQYDSPNFNENDEKQSKTILDLMQKMQDLGQPPAAMLDEMAPGMNFGAEGIPKDLKDLENCNIM